jgi:hypothetical protein
LAHMVETPMRLLPYLVPALLALAVLLIFVLPTLRGLW